MSAEGAPGTPGAPGGPSFRAVTRALNAWDMQSHLNPRTDVIYAVHAAHDPGLGLDRSVCLRDVTEALQSDDRFFGPLEDPADFVERKFTQVDP